MQRLHVHAQLPRARCCEGLAQHHVLQHERVNSTRQSAPHARKGLRIQLLVQQDLPAPARELVARQAGGAHAPGAHEGAWLHRTARVTGLPPAAALQQCSRTTSGCIKSVRGGQRAAGRAATRHALAAHEHVRNVLHFPHDGIHSVLLHCVHQLPQLRNLLGKHATGQLEQRSRLPCQGCLLLRDWRHAGSGTRRGLTLSGCCLGCVLRRRGGMRQPIDSLLC